MANIEKRTQPEKLAKALSSYSTHPTLEAFPPETIAEGGIVVLRATPEGAKSYDFEVDDGVVKPQPPPKSNEAHWDTKGLRSSSYEARVQIQIGTDTKLAASTRIMVLSRQVQASVTLQRSAAGPTNDQALWVAIRNRTDAISFDRYDEFINRLLCLEDKDKHKATCPSDQSAGAYGATQVNQIRTNLKERPNIYGPDAYYLLKLASQAFLIFESGIVIDHRRNPDGVPTADQPVPGLEDPEFRLGRSVTLDKIKIELAAYLGTVADANGKLPYLQRIVNALIPQGSSQESLPYCEEILQHRFSCPSLLELIWSYWEEEGMLVQTLNAIARRFQNRGSGPRDPLANLEIDPLRPLNNLLWGFVQDEYNRLTVPRRAYEYDHHYGLTLVGKAVPKLTPADSRSKFIEAFHNLVNRVAIFFRADADTTVIADAFPLLNSLKEVHLLLAEGAHNQFGDLPWTARAEMLNMQWFLARPEIREFLRGRHMVPYQEPWMGAVDDMKRLQGWTDTTVTHFHELGVTGERILLSVRYGDWVNLNNTEDQAKSWARYWKPEVQLFCSGGITLVMCAS